jgi:hypothetical protein
VTSLIWEKIPLGNVLKAALLDLWFNICRLSSTETSCSHSRVSYSVPSIMSCHQHTADTMLGNT